MRKNPRLWGLVAVLVIAAGLASTIGIGSATASAASCTPTGFSRDNIDLTAALINPSSTVTGTVDAGGCNIGVYYGPGHSGIVKGATVENANYYGIVNDGGSVSISNSTVTNIGEQSGFDGTQHGVGIYWAYNSNATGTIKNNAVTNYQKGGITVNGFGSSAAISGNTVTGIGAVDFIAQNGIQIGFGATGTVSNNTVTNNEYTGTNYASSGGILVVGGPYYGDPFSSGISITKNVVTNNDVGVWLSNAEADGTAPLTATNNTVNGNVISKTGLTNISGDTSPPSTPTCGYQAGIADEGNHDNIVNNKVSGSGYLPGSVCNSDGSGTFSTAYDLVGDNLVKKNK
jgi:hypothetical protein